MEERAGKRRKMLNRQKCVLYMVERARRPVTYLELTKWAFLLAHEMPSCGGAAFYDFFPYQYGPFSFMLFREVDGLAQSGYLRQVKIGHRDGWEGVPDVPGDTGSLSRDVRADAARTVERFVGRSSDDLIDYVYEGFPWYTVNSRIRQMAKRPDAEAAVYTIGYEGCSIDRFLNALMRVGIRRVVDVRRNPVARRYGFHKSSLSRLCGKGGVDYVHVPELGIPSELRRSLAGPAAYARLFETYEKKLLPQEPDAVAMIARMVGEKPTALMCVEADPRKCHRSCVANAVAAACHLPVHHIWGKTCDPVLS
jgi:uncharacterized protein (DUF488 family)